jgi:hypothetical protein
VRIQGFIRNSLNNEPLQYSTVYVKGKIHIREANSADSDGYFILDIDTTFTKTNDAWILFQAVGYNSDSLRLVEIIKDDINKELDIKLTPCVDCIIVKTYILKPLFPPLPDNYDVKSYEIMPMKIIKFEIPKNEIIQRPKKTNR